VLLSDGFMDCWMCHKDTPLPVHDQTELRKMIEES
jgi:hypothetical protein